MIIVVNDACFLIDLIDVDLLDEFFHLGFQPYITPSVLAELEGDVYRKASEGKYQAEKAILA